MEPWVMHSSMVPFYPAVYNVATQIWV